MQPNEVIAKIYLQLKLALTEKLGSQGYQPVHEEHNDPIFDSRYIIWSNNEEALRLTWDGKESWFILEITKDLPLRALTYWDEIIITPFSVEQCSETYARTLIRDFLNTLQ